MQLSREVGTIRAENCGRPIQISQSTLIQRERMRQPLVEANGNWGTLPQIMRLAVESDARILELCRRGFAIKNLTQPVEGARHSWFRLVCDPDSGAVFQ
jgi:hypothetical protein